MIIPSFDSSGNLPPGIHLTTIEGFEKRFAYTIIRKEIFGGILKLIDDLKKIGCKRVFIDGSYVTNKRIPGDFDACWDNTGIDLATAILIVPELWDRTLQKLKYDGDVFPAFILESDSRKMFIDFFQEDKLTGLRKGIIEIKL